MQGAGAGAIAVSGGTLGKVWLVSQAFKYLKALTTSTIWNTFSAVQKQRLADTLMNDGVEAFTRGVSNYAASKGSSALSEQTNVDKGTKNK
jgi:hypothetical protein